MKLFKPILKPSHCYTRSYKKQKIHFATITVFVESKNFFLREIKLVLFERNHPDVLKYSKNVLSKFKNFCIKILIRLFYKNVDLILANTKESAYDWSKISGKKVINIYNPAYDKKIMQILKLNYSEIDWIQI